MSTQLEEAYVQFSAKGQESLKAAIDSIHKSLAEATNGINTFGGQLVAGFDKSTKQTGYLDKGISALNDRFLTLGKTLNSTLQIGTMMLGGFVSAGIAAGGMGQILGFELERVGRVLAGLFRPEIEKAVGLIHDFSEGLAKMTDLEKDGLAKTLAFSAAMAAFARGGIVGVATGLGILGLSFEELGPTIKELERTFKAFGKALVPVIEALAKTLLPVLKTITEALQALSTETIQNTVKWMAIAATFIVAFQAITMVISGVVTLIAVLKELRLATIAVLTLSGPKGWATLLAALGATAAAIKMFDMLEQETIKRVGAEDKKDKKPPRDEETRKAGAVEDVKQTWVRIAQASRFAGGKPVDEQQLEVEKLIQLAVEKAAKLLEGMRPAVAR